MIFEYKLSNLVTYVFFSPRVGLGAHTESTSNGRGKEAGEGEREGGLFYAKEGHPRTTWRNGKALCPVSLFRAQSPS